MAEDQDPLGVIRKAYEPIVRARHPGEVLRWPILTGADLTIGGSNGWLVIFLKHTGNSIMTSTNPIGEISSAILGQSGITDGTIEIVRERLLKHFRATLDDAVFLVPPSGEVRLYELNSMLARHEAALGLAKMKIFLSHKSPDKALVRDFKAILSVLGFDPWLDEDAMAAGVQLDRAILKGMQDSCAAVFFITPKFADEAFLATEINYAINEQRDRPNQFSIITLVLEEDGQRPVVPGLLKQFVWKEPANSLQALREVVRALPIKVGTPQWR